VDILVNRLHQTRSGRPQQIRADRGEMYGADSTRQCNFTHGMMREAAMPKCFSPSKVKEHECEPITASLKVSVTKFMH